MAPIITRADLDEVQAILDKYGITREALDDAEQAKAAAIAAGKVVPIGSKK